MLNTVGTTEIQAVHISMMNINLSNVEEIVFYDKSLQRKLPEFKHLFDQWMLAIKAPTLRSLGKRSILDFLNNLENEHIAIIEKYLGSEITIDKLDYHIVKNYNFQLEDTDLNGLPTYADFAIFRNEDQLYISFWR